MSNFTKSASYWAYMFMLGTCKEDIARFRNYSPISDAEISISDCPLYSFLYAREVLKGRFMLGESNGLMNDSYLAVAYVEEIIKKPYKPLEDTILKSSYSINRYCSRILNSRWKEGEEALLKFGDIHYIVMYYYYIANREWDDGRCFINDNIRKGKKMCTYLMDEYNKLREWDEEELK